MKHYLSASFALIALAAMILPPNAGTNTPTPASENGYVTRTYTDAKGRSITYYLHIPDPQQDHASYPLVLLLHGGGERGQSANSPEQNRSILLGDPYVKQWTTAEVQTVWPSFIVVPQLMNSQQWVAVPSAQGSYHLAPQPTDTLLLAKEIADALQRTYPDIDPGRLYITGISIGGYGVWDAIERWPHYFAAAAPVSGAGDPAGAIRLIHLPIWAFHGANDGDPSPASTRSMIQAIRLLGGQPRYTEFPQAGHDIWLQVYTSPVFLSWLFAQKTVPDRTGTLQVALLQNSSAFFRKYWALLILFLLALLLFNRNLRKYFQQKKSTPP
jgi:predicted peptidase